MRHVKRMQGLVLIGLLVLGSPMGVVWAEIVMKILVVNPSETETKEFTIHSVLPPEVNAEDVLDPDGLQVEYDSQGGTTILTGTVTLEPKQSLTKRIVLEDVWMIPAERFATVRQELEAILGKLQGTEYEPQGRLLSESFTRRLAAIEASQEQPFVSPAGHISLYRENLTALQAMDTDLVSLRQLMVMAALQPASKQAVLAGTGAGAASEGAGQDRGSLSILTTWKLIFMILSLLGLVSLSFFIVWQRQLKLQLAKQAVRDAEPVAEDLFTSGNGQSNADVPPALQPRVQPKTHLSS